MGHSPLIEGNSGSDEQQSREEPATKSQLPNKSRSGGLSIPLSAIVAILLQSLLTIYLIYLGVSILVETREDHFVPPAIWQFLLVRLVVAIGVLTGMRHRRYIARKVSRGLCTLGLIFGGIVVIYILTVGVTSLHQYALLKIASAHCLVWFSLLACLGTKSAAKWFSE
ncbi:MAG: hypothetical protein JWP89_146 [Schlesneria sp.]|nr:hypothetical protein [Schlesneria sp.]